MSFSSLLRSVFKPEAWCCALRFNEVDSNCILNDKQTPFIVVPDSKRYWTADPFLIKNDGRYYLFFEAFDRLQKKGLLGYREITDNKIGDIKIIYESDTHLSFPFIYEDNGDYYIVPESGKANELFRLKCTQFPDKWEKDSVITSDCLVDTVLYKKNNIMYYISERVDSRNCFDRVDLFYELDGDFKEFNNNPVKTDIDSARGAGRLFEYEDMLVRPSQSCGKAYGEYIAFNRVMDIEINSYKEEPLCNISVNEISLDCENNFTGIHTYNRLDNIEVIDLKLPAKFNMYNFIGAIVKLFRRIFK